MERGPPRAVKARKLGPKQCGSWELPERERGHYSACVLNFSKKCKKEECYVHIKRLAWMFFTS